MADREDFLDALYRMVHEFRKHGFEPPKIIVLKTHEDGMRLLHAISQQDCMVFQNPAPGRSSYGQPITDGNGETWIDLELIGVFIQFPAVPYKTHAGSAVWT